MANAKHANRTVGIRLAQFHPMSMMACFRLVLLLGLGIYSLSSWAAVTATPVLITDQVSVRYSGLRLNRATNTFDTLATLTNTSNNDIQTPIQLVIDSVSSTGINLSNADGVLADGRRYVNVPVANNHLLPGKTVTGVLLKFSNPKRVSFSFRHSVLGVLPASNHPPIAHAGENRSVTINTEVSLSAVASSDEDGDSLTYRWQLLEKPTGSTATLSNANTLQPQFTVDLKGSYRIELIVNDGQIDSQPAYVTISTENSKPIAKAGDDQTVKVQQTALLDGRASTDVDNDPISFLWELLTKPSNSQTTLNNANTETPNLTPDKPGSYTVQLKVNDGQLDSAPDQVIINTENSKPVANAGPNQTAQTGDNVILDGRLSTDVDSDPLSYVWSLLSKPANSQPTLKQHDQVQAILTPDLHGDYVAQLIVNDSKLNSEPATSLITVSAKPPLNRAPQITSSANVTAVVAALYQYDVDASDADNDTLTYSLTAYPTGMSINSQTGLISWTPATNQLGSQSVNVQVSDGKGGSDSQSFSITVSDVAQATVPSVVNQTRAAAEAAIQHAKLRVGTLTFQHNAQADGSVISQSPIGNTTSAIGTAVTLTISLGPDTGLPPNPITLAPRLDPTVATNTYVASEFLYKGSSPIQTLSNGQPLAQDTIDAKRAAVIRGKVLDKQNNPLPGVTLTILNHPEYGQTQSRLDGQFDLAVNGGGYLVVNYQKDGYLPAQRQLNLPWQDYKIAEDVVIIKQDTKVSTIDLTANSIQVAQGSSVTDKDGTRQATLIVPQGTTARVYNPDGTTREVSNLNLRLTEYTVGDNGSKAMPGPLPPSSGYTYALELKAEEATVKQNGQEVLFNQPVPFYVDNFLNFPVGETAPLGYYDDQKAAWIPADSGRVIQIITINNGIADIDSDGDGTADNALGLTSAERQKLGVLYAAGKTLWRVSLNHLSAWDINWGFAPPPDAIAPNPNGRPQGSQPELTDPNCSSGSIIECENQTLGETLPVVGTPYTLNYRSSRQPGRRRASLDIPLSGDTVPASLQRIDLVIHLEGRSFTSSFSPAARQSYRFDWDGLDAYGRPVQGETFAIVDIGFVYRGVYTETSKFGYNGNGLRITGEIKTRDHLTIWQRNLGQLGLTGWIPHAIGLGGWSLDIHHVYNPGEKTLYLGSGNRRSQQASSSAIITTSAVITTVAGNGDPGTSPGSNGDGGSATAASVRPTSIEVAPDGSLYIGDSVNNKVRRVGPDGIITTMAGNGRRGYSNDGGSAILANLEVNDTALGPDGNLYIADSSNYRIRRVGPDGIITTVAGNGLAGNSGDGGPATEARLQPDRVALDSDGNLYIADLSNHRIRRVGPDGIITTVAGNGQFAYDTSDGLQATATRTDPYDIALGSDGSLYIAEFTRGRIRRVGPDGFLTTVAGNGQLAFSGDGGPATSAAIRPCGLDLGPDGSFYIAECQSGRVRRVGPEGIISTIAGSGNIKYGVEVGDGGPATAAILYPLSVALGPDGNVLVADQFYRIRKVGATSLPGFSLTEISISSEDGAELYHFTADGRHIRTLNTLTGAILYTFNYDGTGRLSSVIDGNNNVTTIERDAVGNPTALMAPFGQRTTLTLDANGYLAKVTNPGRDAYQMSYNAAGLLTAFTDPNGNSSTMSYEADGRLIKDLNAVGGSQSLTSIHSENGYEVSVMTALGRTKAHGVTNLSTGNQQRTIRFPDGTQSTTMNATNGTHMTTAADGTVTDWAEIPDPRFAMQSPIKSKSTIASGGLTSTITRTRTTNLSSPGNPLSLTGLNDTVTINGRRSTSVYDAATKTVTNTSAAGRKATTTIDDLGRVLQAQVTGIQATNLSYDTRGRLAAINQGASPNIRDTSFSYNPEGFLDTVTDSLGRTASFNYDDAGRITRQTLPDGREIAYSYDGNGNLTSLTPPGRPGHLFHYTATNQTVAYQPPQVIGTGNTLYSYDLDKELTKITRPDGQTLEFAYDNAGRLSNMNLPTGQISYTYSVTTGKLTGITAQDGGSLDYSYNGALLTKTAWTGSIAGSVERTYDNDFRATSLSVNGANPVAFQYDSDSLLIKAGNLSLSRSAQNGLLTGTTLGSLTDSYVYDGFAEVTAYEAKYGTSSLLRFEYDHDKLGRITQKRQIKGGITHRFDYGYDIAGRLTEVKRDGAVTASYGYDSNGNRTHLNGVEIAHYDDQDRLLDYQGTSYQSTANGELQQKTVGSQTTQYDFDVLGNLKKVTLPSGSVIDYLVDGQNRRIGKKVNGALVQGFLYQDQLKPIAELDSNGNVKSRFVYATGINVPGYMIKGGATYRIIKDHLGSPRLVVDIATNTVIQEMDYDAFGNVTLDTNPGFQPFGFAGGLYDRDTRLVRFGARDYEAETGRWVAKDPILYEGKSANLYSYVTSNPLNRIDLFGLEESINQQINNFNSGTGGLIAGGLVAIGSAAGSAAITGAGGVYAAGAGGFALGTEMNDYMDAHGTAGMGPFGLVRDLFDLPFELERRLEAARLLADSAAELLNEILNAGEDERNGDMANERRTHNASCH